MIKTTISTESRQRGILWLVLFVSVSLTEGCANYQVRTPDSDPLEKQYQGGTMHGWLWGAYMRPEVMAAECQGEAINDVVIKRSYLQDLASVISLGMWMPIDVRYRCRAPGIDGGAFPE